MNRVVIYCQLLIIAASFIACSPRIPGHYLAVPEGQLKDFLQYRGAQSVPLVSAHRGGGEYAGFPENAIQSFDYILRHTPAIIEFDVAMTKDSVLILMHDNTLDRTTTCTGNVAERTWAEIQLCLLEDNKGRVTPFRVPRYEDALRWAKGKTVLTVDVKRGVPLDSIVAYIQRLEAQHYAAVITYNLRDARRVYDLDSTIMLSVTIRDEAELEQTLAAGIPSRNIIAFTGTQAPAPALNQRLHELGVLTIFGTLGGMDQRATTMRKKQDRQLYRQCIADGIDIIATDRPIEASRAIRKLTPRRSEQLLYFSRTY